MKPLFEMKCVTIYFHTCRALLTKANPSPLPSLLYTSCDHYAKSSFAFGSLSMGVMVYREQDRAQLGWLW